jgi:hypothetical protein
MCIYSIILRILQKKLKKNRLYKQIQNKRYFLKKIRIKIEIKNKLGTTISF